MDELKNPLNGQSSGEGSSLLSEAPTMSVGENRATGTVAGLPVRQLRAAVAGLAISGLGYFALAASPELNKSFTRLTGLSVVDPLGASGYGSSCGGSPEACGGGGGSCGMAPYGAESGCGGEMACGGETMSVSTEAGAGSCCSSGMAVSTDSATACPSVAGSCSTEGVGECSGSCPFAAAGGEQIVAEGTPAEEPIEAVSEYVDAANGTE